MKKTMSQKIGILVKCKPFSITLLLFVIALVSLVIFDKTYWKLAIILSSMSLPIIGYSALIISAKDTLENG